MTEEEIKKMFNFCPEVYNKKENKPDPVLLARR